MDASRTITRSDAHRDPQKRSSYLFLSFFCDRPLEPGARFRLDGFDVVEIGRGETLRADSATENGAKVLRLAVPDPRISSTHARVLNVLGSWMLEDRKSKNGTLLNGRRTVRSEVPDGALVEVGHTFFSIRRLPAANGPDEIRAQDLEPAARGLATFSPALAAEFERVALVARSRMPVLLLGESGTGKEVIARAIHELSGRAGGFVAVNCGAIPEGLVESELFGHRRGSFPGAEDHAGLVRSSDRGTLLLDEIGDLPLAAQAKLLRVLQEEEVRPVGATAAIKIDLRVVAATHRDLEALSREEKFRPDLLARLSGVALHLPPLRERREDLGLLIAAVLRKHGGEGSGAVSFSPEAARALLLHSWPRNVRELEKSVAGAMVLARGGRIDLEHLPPGFHPAADGGQGPTGTEVRPPSLPEAAPRGLSEQDRKLYEELVMQLRAHHGNVTETARAMGKARTQVQRWMRRFGLDPASFH